MHKLSRLFIICLLASTFFLSSCNKKTTPTPAPTPTPIPKLIEIENGQKPYISLIPRQDGHELKLIIDRLPQIVSQIEYELLYTANDEGLEIEKGVGDTIKLNKTTSKIERDILLGTSSCTNGCKYKYDTGVSGGTLSLNFYTQNGQVFTYESPFVLTTTADINKDKSIGLPSDNFVVNLSGLTKTNHFFIVIKNFGTQKPIQGFSSVYSIFSSGDGKSKILSISPEDIQKEDSNSLLGDYIRP